MLLENRDWGEKKIKISDKRHAINLGLERQMYYLPPPI